MPESKTEASKSQVKPNQVRARKNRHGNWSFYVVVYDIKKKKYTGMFFRHSTSDDMIYSPDFSPKDTDPVIVDNFNTIGKTVEQKFKDYCKEHGIKT